MWLLGFYHGIHIASIDAMGCQTKIADKIVQNGTDYLLQVKGNQKGLLENIQDSFSLLNPKEMSKTDYLGHDRVETRRCFVLEDLSLIEKQADWQNPHTLIKIESEIYYKKTGKITIEERFYISSRIAEAKDFGSYVRNHWEIESLHWCLDVIFNEYFQAKRNKNGILNFNTLSKCAIGLLNEEKTFQKSKPGKQQRAFAQRDYRELILNI